MYLAGLDCVVITVDFGINKNPAKQDSPPVASATCYYSAAVRSCPEGFLYDREVWRTFLSYKK
jgi:hypothetical protein